MTRSDRRGNDGRRVVDTRPSISLPAAVDAVNCMAVLEREKLRLQMEWGNIIRPTEALNGKHIGDHYEAARKAQR